MDTNLASLLVDLNKCLGNLSISLGSANNQFSFSKMWGSKLDRVNSVSDNELELTFEKNGKKMIVRISAITKEDGRAVLEIGRINET